MPGDDESPDPDALDGRGGPRPAGRPAHRSVPLLLLIVGGGAAGTAVRATISSAVPAQPGGIPWATLGVNVTGAFVLGLLLELLARNGPDSGWRRAVRLGVGTGFLGGYTTYSALAVEVSRLTAGDGHLVGPVYAAVSLVLGPVAAVLGYLVARRGGPGGDRRHGGREVAT